MKFLHTADIHLKATPHTDREWNIDRSKEIWDTFEKLIKYAEEEKVDLLLIAGDLFHRQPLLRELKEADYLFSTLTRAKVVLTAGNHDYIKNDSNYNKFKWNDNVYFISSEVCSGVFIKELNTRVYGLSYHEKEITKNLYDDIKVQNPDTNNILLIHGGDDRHIPIKKEKLRTSGFDYIAMGHIHKPQSIIDDFCAYSGSLEPLDYTETGKHGFIIGEINNKRVKTSFVPFAKREYKELHIQSEPSYTEGRIINIISTLLENDKKNIYRIYIEGIRDEDIIYNTEKIYKLGLIATVEDNSKPSYDFEKIMERYKGTVVEKFIHKLYKKDMSEIEEKALYYGIKALLDEAE